MWAVHNYFTMRNITVINSAHTHAAWNMDLCKPSVDAGVQLIIQNLCSPCDLILQVILCTNLRL